MATHKRFRQGQILKLITSEAISSQDELRRRLAHLKLRVTQATLSRDIAELKLVKTARGLQVARSARLRTALRQLAPLARAVREYLLDVRPADNLLVLKTPPGGAQPLAAALDGERLREVAGTIAGDDTVSDHHPVAAGAGRRAATPGGYAPMTGPQRVAVVGATGYAGFELARLLLRHPGIAKPTFYLRESAKPAGRP